MLIAGLEVGNIIRSGAGSGDSLRASFTQPCITLMEGIFALMAAYSSGVLSMKDSPRRSEMMLSAILSLAVRSLLMGLQGESIGPIGFSVRFLLLSLAFCFVEGEATPPSYAIQHSVVARPCSPTASIAKHVWKQCRSAVHRAGFAVGQSLGFDIQQLACYHASQNQHCGRQQGVRRRGGTRTRRVPHTTTVGRCGPSSTVAQPTCPCWPTEQNAWQDLTDPSLTR